MEGWKHKKTVLLQKHDRKERELYYPTSDSWHIFFSSCFHSTVVFLCFPICRVSLHLTGSSLQVTYFHRKLYHSFGFFVGGIYETKKLSKKWALTNLTHTKITDIFSSMRLWCNPTFQISTHVQNKLFIISSKMLYTCCCHVHLTGNAKEDILFCVEVIEEYGVKLNFLDSFHLPLNQGHPLR